MKATHQFPLFEDLSTQEAETVQGGRCYRRSYRSSQPTYYSYRPTTSYSYYPSYSYGYGYGGYGSGYSGGSGGSVSQTVNVNVRYDD